MLSHLFTLVTNNPMAAGFGIVAILAAGSVGDPIATVVKVVLVVIVVLWLIAALGYGTGLPRLR